MDFQDDLMRSGMDGVTTEQGFGKLFNVTEIDMDDRINKARYDEMLEISIIFQEVEPIVGIIVPIMFGIIALTGFFGNSLVILVVVLNQQMQSTTNLLIASLAIADLLFVVFCIPFSAIDYMLFTWPFGDFWCRSVQYLIVVTTLASIYTLVLMSIDRFLAVVHPMRSRMLRTEQNTKIAIGTLWIIVLSICIPVFLTHGVVVSQ